MTCSTGATSSAKREAKKPRSALIKSPARPISPRKAISTLLARRRRTSPKSLPTVIPNSGPLRNQRPPGHCLGKTRIRSRSHKLNTISRSVPGLHAQGYLISAFVQRILSGCQIVPVLLTRLLGLPRIILSSHPQSRPFTSQEIHNGKNPLLQRHRPRVQL